MHYFLNASEKYDVSLVRPANSSLPFRITAVVARNGENIVEWETHHGGAFVFSGDKLIYARYSPISTGCEIKAFDLQNKQQIWSSNLKCVGPISHSIYRNQINLVLDDDVIEVYGNESAGQYIVKLDLRTGKLIFHALGNKAGNKF